MANFQWTGNANTGDFSTAANWQPSVGAPPGPSDTALIESPATPITGTGTAYVLSTSGPVKFEGHFTATYGCPVNAQPLTLGPGAVLTTPMLHFVAGLVSNPSNTGNLTVGAGSRVVITGRHIPDNYAIELAEPAGSNATLVVEGAGAVVNGGNLPMSVGQNGAGVLTIRQGGVVSVGNDDPLIYPWCLVVGNHPGSQGTVEVEQASLLAHGQIIVGRKSMGTLNVNEGGLVCAESMAIGWAPTTRQGTTTNEGIGTVTVKGGNARLIVDDLLEVQHMGTGSLTVADHGFVSAGIGLLVNGTLSLADGQIETTALAVNATLTGSGTVIAAQGTNNSGAITADGKLILIGDIDNSGSITVAAGGDLRCFGAVTDEGTILLQENSKASLEAVSGQTISFGGTDATLVLRSPGVFSGSISGFGATHKIVLDAEVSNIAYSPVDKVLTATGVNGNVVAQLNMIGTYAPNSFSLTSGFPSVIKG